MTWVFWQPLWAGQGFIGGDTFPYFYPQKTFLAERLHADEFPLWNNLVGQGYPLLAESQTGVLYPPNLILYRLLDVQTAYNACHLGHALVATIGTWLLARRYGLGRGGALFCSLVFVYGWFPARSCLEWAIVGGAYFPLILWSTESYLQLRHPRWLVLTALLLMLFLFAGHFHLAFVTLLATVGYVAIRPAVKAMPPEPPGVVGSGPATTNEGLAGRGRNLGIVIATIAVGFLLAAAQILPTLELRGRSQRFDFSSEHDPLYGRIPPAYLSHMVAPWLWFNDTTNPDTLLGGSNRVEAHLYCGLLPLALALWTAWNLLRRREWSPVSAWLTLGMLFLFLATGEPLVWLKSLPGFGFFRGAGRYGLVTAFAIALASGAAVDRLIARRRWSVQWAGLAVLVGVMAFDLLRVVPYVSYVVAVRSPLEYREQSQVRQILQTTPHARVFGPGQNVLTIAGLSQLPVYLGIGPAEYFSPSLNPTKLPEDRAPTDGEIAAHVDWFRESGVTHILGQKPWDTTRWPLRLVWTGFDDLFNRAWGQFQEPLHLYELDDAPGRITLDEGATGVASITVYEANRVVLDCTLETPGRLVLKDLAYPGWTVSIDGVRAVAQVAQDRFRAVPLPAGRHVVEWTFRSASIGWGSLISGLTAGGLVGAWVLGGRRRRAD